jgi:N utilization substance protein B
MLFQLDLGSVAIQDLEQSFLPGASAPEAAKLLALQLARNTWENVADLDGRLRSFAQHWDLSRMAAVDRNVLRLAAYEILHDPQVPKSVAINEALEIVKRFSTEESSRFVNGVLDRLEKPPV